MDFAVPHFPNLLNEIVEFLRAQNLHLSKTSRDGRINSAFNEDEIFNLLEANFALDFNIM